VRQDQPFSTIELAAAGLIILAVAAFAGIFLISPICR
jgi:hypothetical protein